MNIAVAGIVTCTIFGYLGGVIISIAHGFCSAGLFLVSGYGINRTHLRDNNTGYVFPTPLR